MSSFEVIKGGLLDIEVDTGDVPRSTEFITVGDDDYEFIPDQVLDAPITDQGVHECPSCSNVWFRAVVMFDEDTDVVGVSLSSIECADCGTKIATRQVRALMAVEDQECGNESLDGQPS